MKTTTFNYILFLLLISGCAYQSTTYVYIKAAKASYPTGVSSIGLENGELTINRQMNAEGMFNLHKNYPDNINTEVENPSNSGVDL